MFYSSNSEIECFILCACFLDLVPFTDYNVSVAASNEERGAGAFSLEMVTRTSEGGEEHNIVITTVDH